MDSAFQGLNFNICLIYMDDIFFTFKYALEETFGEVRVSSATVETSEFETEVNQMLICCNNPLPSWNIGISQEGIATDPSQTESIRNWPVPTCVKEARAFVSFGCIL